MIKHPPTVDLTKLKREKVRTKLVQIDDLKLDDILDIDNISIINSQNLVKLDEPQPNSGTILQNDTVIHITEDTESHILVGTDRRINSSTISTRRRIRGSRRHLPWATRPHSDLAQSTIEDDLVPGISYDLARIQPNQDADRELNIQNESIQEGEGENRSRGRGRGRGRASRGRRHRQVRAKLHIDTIRNESQLVICGNCGEKGHNIKDCVIRRVMPHSDHSDASDQSDHSDNEEYKQPISQREEIITPSRSLQPLCYSLLNQNFTPPFALGRSLKRSRKCGFCKEEGHNARTCHYINLRFRSRSREDNAEE